MAAKKNNDAGSMRNFFGLQPAATPTQDPEIQPVASPNTMSNATDAETSRDKLDTLVLETTRTYSSDAGKTGTRTASTISTNKIIGRPPSSVERVPVTLSVKSDTDAAIADLTRSIQSWRGRRRGVPKVGRNDIVDFAVEYLQKRITHGADAAEELYQLREADERNTYLH